jgi:hypothetical protein
MLKKESPLVCSDFPKLSLFHYLHGLPVPSCQETETVTRDNLHSELMRLTADQNGNTPELDKRLNRCLF